MQERKILFFKENATFSSFNETISECFPKHEGGDLDLVLLNADLFS